MTDADVARARDAAGLLLAMARGGLLGSDPETLLAVADLCRFVEDCGHRLDAIAASLGVHINTVQRTATGKQWGHVDAESNE